MRMIIIIKEFAMSKQVETREQRRKETIMAEVGSLFRRKANDVYMGRVTTLQVLCYVSMILSERGFKLTRECQTEVFGAMVELGPCGEGDEEWGREWGVVA